MRLSTKKMWKRLIPVIAVFLAINIGFGIEYYLRIPKEWYTGTSSGFFEAGHSRAFVVNPQYKYVYLANGTELQIIDINDLSSPTLVSSFNKSENVYNLAYEGNNLVLAGRRNATILDISNPISPVELSQIYVDINYTITDLEIINDLLYVAVRADSVYLANPFRVCYIFDISDPSNPIEVNVLHYFGLQVDELLIENEVLYLVESETEVRTFDLSNATNPIAYNPGSYSLFGLVSQLRQYVDARKIDVQLVGDTRYIFVADYDNGYIIGDVTNPQEPQVIDGVQLDKVISLYLTSSLAYILDENGQVRVYSLNKPTKFRLVGRYDPYEDTPSLKASDIFVHVGTQSIFILRNDGLLINRIVEGVKNDYYREATTFSYTWIAVGLSLVVCVPLGIAVVSRSRDKYTYST